MQLDQNPVFRKIIAPWYDSEVVCFLVLFSMIVVFLFGLTGISAAAEKPEYNDHIWVPVLLVLMSAGVFISTAVRLLKRFARRVAE